MRRVDLEVDGLPVDALVVSCYPRRLALNLLSDLIKVVELAPWDVEELAPFLLPCYARRCVWDVHFIVLVGVFSVAGEVDELENERPPGDDATASGKKVSANDVLEHG